MNKQSGLPATPSQASGLHGGRGQTLIEILLAFSVAILVLGAIVVGVTTSLRNTQYTKNQGLANSYAQEGMAIIRQIRNSRWSDFENYTAAKYCLGPSPVALKELELPNKNCGYEDVAVGDIFSREVVFEHRSPTCSGGSKVTVAVAWFDSKCPSGTDNIYCHEVDLVSCFSDIGKKQKP